MKGRTAATFDRAITWVPIWDPSRKRQGMEHLLLGERVADSVMVAFDESGVPYRMSYRLRWDAAWHVRSARVEVRTEGGVNSLTLRSDGAGNWRNAEQQELSELRGAIDVDIWPTPFTNTFPIRRLGTQLRKRHLIDVAWIGAPQLSLLRQPQAYTRIAEGLYRFESTDTGFTAELPVDEQGIVLDYPGLFKRTS